MVKLGGLYGWLRNITCYILFMSILDNLLPGKKYGKYLKLFAGMVLILLVVQPFTGSLRLEDRIAHYYESSVFRYQADDLRQEILGVEEQRLEQMIVQYEAAVAQDLILMAEDSGLAVVTCSAVIERKQESEQFGMVQSIRMEVVQEEIKNEAGDWQENAPEESVSPEILVPPMEPVMQVEPVGVGEETDSGVSREENRERQEKERTAVRELRRKIASYYDLEEAYVEIQVVERQG